jgi:hypothetical protein
MSLSLPALADRPATNCPPGAWFCAEAEVQAPQPPAVAPPAVVEEEEDAPAAPPPARPARRLPPPPPPLVEVPGPPPAAPPPVVIYQPVPVAPPTRVIIITPGYRYQPYQQAYPAYRPVRVVSQPPQAAKARPKCRSEWGLNLRVEGLALGKGAAEGAGMGGVGLSLRYRPVPAFAFDAGLDIVTGTDYNGFTRTETPFSLNGMLFVNPRSHVQLYLIAGATYSHAKVNSPTASPLLKAGGDEDGGFGASYSYLGGQGGAGLEFRVSRHFALDIDGLGFVRHRTDDGPNPEFVNKAGQTTKNSGGGLFRGGLSFWW